ncbi:MAG: DegT/DnrJ/EryC1/StrS family aminotransferase [bacterium]|nr:DegT/DnrJ/EryC1/StrS family aminotransferase [bacterium]
MVVQIQPWIEGEDVEAVRAAAASTFVTEHDQTRRFEELLAELTGARHVIAYANGTCALFAVLRALGVGPCDEVIVPDLTFVASANAVILAGAEPVFCDVDAKSMMLDPAHVAEIIGPRTKAIMPVHLYGLPADVDSIVELAAGRGLHVVEDAAQGIGVRRNGRHTGTTGAAGVLSFYGNKTLTTGEGSAILTDDDALAEACYRLKNHGRLEKGVFIHDQIGFNFSFTDLQAALGVSQLGKLDRVVAEKARIRAQYERRLAELEWLTLQEVPPGVEPVFWFTNIFCDDVEGLAEALAAQDIQTRRFFYPLHLQPCYRHYYPPACPTSRRLYETGLSLPSWCGLEATVIDRICDAIIGYGVPA